MSNPAPEPSPLPQLVHTIAEVRAAVQAARARGQTIGFVPTMGALHEGHGQLIAACRADCDFVVVSIYVNPTQFGVNEDYTKYPRTLDSDLALSGRSGAHLVFVPSDTEMYPNGPSSTVVEVPGPSARLEGASRPTHFRGVATVVLKLLNIVGPDRAHFGEKDYQQLLVVQRLVQDLAVPVAIQGVPTVREPDGLAMSSRNRYQSAEPRQGATVLWRALQRGAAAAAAGERSADRIRQILTETINSEPLAELDYAEVADAVTLEPLETLQAGRPARMLLAARLGGQARLIDNAPVPLPAPPG